MAGLAGDDDAGSAWGDDSAELLQDMGDADQVDVDDGLRGLAWAGDRPAVWTTWTTVPRWLALSASARTDSAEAASTWAVLLWKPATLRASAAAWAASSLRSANRMVLPTPMRRAMAWPMEPAPMTTTISLEVAMVMACLFLSGSKLPGVDVVR